MHPWRSVPSCAFVLSILFSSGAVAQTPEAKTYQIGPTPASIAGLKAVAGAVPPLDISNQAAAQQRVAISIARSVPGPGAAPGKPKSFGDARDQCRSTLGRWDWRDHDGTTPIRDQKTCGACFVFGALAAYESSYRIINRKEVEVSEQELLNCAKSGNCTGGWHSTVFNFIRDIGAVDVADMLYTARFSSCSSRAKGPYSAKNWSYIDSHGGVASVSAIKEALCDHGVIVSAVLATGDFLQYKSGIFNEFAEGNGSSDVNHDVAIVGWDNSQQVWIVKNSWSKGWGEQGYMRIRWHSNNIGYGAAWIDAVPIRQSNAVREATQRSLRDATSALQPKDIRALNNNRFSLGH